MLPYRSPGYWASRGAEGLLVHRAGMRPISKKPEPGGSVNSSHDHFSPRFHKGRPIFRLCNWPVGVGKTQEAGWAPSHTAHSSSGHQHGGQATFHLRGGTHAASLCQENEDSASWGQLEG